jgi:metal-responsive CopG/Arc/MetJ family transcriptional regulator
MDDDLRAVGVRLDEETIQRLDANAEHFGVSRSAIIRAFLDSGSRSEFVRPPQEYERMNAVELTRAGEL